MESGREVVSASFIIPYPPGFPILVPGQVISAEILAFMRALDVSEIHGCAGRAQPGPSGSMISSRISVRSATPWPRRAAPRCRLTGTLARIADPNITKLGQLMPRRYVQS